MSKTLRTRAVVAAAMVSAMVALSAGCGGDSRPQAQVKGVVTLDGVPLDAGTIHYFPQTDAGSPSASADVKDGKYELKTGTGLMKVVVNSGKVAGKIKMYDTPDSPTLDDVRETLPARYNVKSELKADLKAGPNEVNFDLTSDKKKK